MRHRETEIITPRVLCEAIARTPLDHFVVWSGHAAGRQDGSLRSRALECVREVGVAVPLREILRRAACAAGETGLRPELVRDAVRLHQMARPACYLLLRRRMEGDFVAVTRIPWPAGLGRPIAEGEPVIDRRGVLLPGLAATPHEAATVQTAQTLAPSGARAGLRVARTAARA